MKTVTGTLQSIRRYILPGVALVVSQLVSFPSYAFLYSEPSVLARLTKFPDIQVKNNNAYYTVANQSDNTWEVDLALGSGMKGKRIMSWVAWTEIQGPGDLSRDLYAHRLSESYPKGDRPGSVSGSRSSTLPGNELADYAVQACEYHADQLRRQGMSDAEIFSQEREVEGATVYLNIRLKVTLEGGQAWTKRPDSRKLKVICNAWGGPPEPQVPTSTALGVQNDVENFALDVNELYNQVGLCKVELIGSFTTLQPNSKVDYRFEHRADGKKSPIYSATTDGSRLALFKRTFDIPNNTEGAENGEIRLVGVNYDFQSPWKGYSMKCEAPATMDLATVLPPVLDMEVKPAETRVIDDQICPTRVQLVAGIQARSDLEGKVIFLGTQYFSEMHPFQLQNGQNTQIGDYRDVTWETDRDIGTTFGANTTQGGSGPLMSQTLSMGYNVVSLDNEVMYRFEGKNYRVECKQVEGVQAGATALDSRTEQPTPRLGARVPRSKPQPGLAAVPGQPTPFPKPTPGGNLVIDTGDGSDAFNKRGSANAPMFGRSSRDPRTAEYDKEGSSAGNVETEFKVEKGEKSQPVDPNAVSKMKSAAVRPPRIGLSVIETRGQITAGQSTGVHVGVNNSERVTQTAKVRVKVFADDREISNKLLTLQLNPQSKNWGNVNVGVPNGAGKLKIDATIEGAAAGRRTMSRTVGVVQAAPARRQAVPAGQIRGEQMR